MAFIHDRTYSEENRRLPGGVVLCPQVRICKAKMLLQNGLPHLPARVRLGGRLRASENASALDFFGEFYPYPASLTPAHNTPGGGGGEPALRLCLSSGPSERTPSPPVEKRSSNMQPVQNPGVGALLPATPCCPRFP